jgi:hypothetical protein
VQNQITGQADADRGKPLGCACLLRHADVCVEGIGPEWVALQVGLERVNEAIERVHLKGS